MAQALRLDSGGGTTKMRPAQDRFRTQALVKAATGFRAPSTAISIRSPAPGNHHRDDAAERFAATVSAAGRSDRRGRIRLLRRRQLSRDT